MALEFLKGAQQPTAQQAVAYVDDGNATDTPYAAGEVVASVSDLVAVDGAEDVLGYVNAPLGSTTDDATVSEVANVDVSDGEIVLDPGLDSTTDIPTTDQSVVVSGGLFFSPDEAQLSQDVDDTLVDAAGNPVTGLADDIEVFVYTDDNGDELFIERSKGIEMVLQASGY